MEFTDKLNSVLNREEWHMTPQTVNASVCVNVCVCVFVCKSRIKPNNALLLLFHICVYVRSCVCAGVRRLRGVEYEMEEDSYQRVSPQKTLICGFSILSSIYISLLFSSPKSEPKS